MNKDRNRKNRVRRQPRGQRKLVRDCPMIYCYIRADALRALNKLVRKSGYSRNAYMQALIDKHVAEGVSLTVV